MRSCAIVGLCITAMMAPAILLAAPHESSTDPLPNAARAVVAINAFSTGPWVRGDWALKCFLETGHGTHRIRIPMDVIGGWRPEIGRWQRIRLPNGRQWIIKDVPVADIAPANFSEMGRGKADPFGPAMMPETSSTVKNVYPETGDIPSTEEPAPQSAATAKPQQAQKTAAPQPQKIPKPQEGGISLTPMAESPANQDPNKRSNDKKPLELVYNGRDLEIAGVTMQTGEQDTPKPQETATNMNPIAGEGQLLTGSPSPRMTAGVWELGFQGKSHFLSAEERLNGINERIPMSWELYTMGFLNLPKIKYKGVEKIRARWCYTVELSGGGGPYAKALVWLDTEFGAPLEAELYDYRGNLAKTVRAVSIQRIKITQDGAPRNEWILKQWEVVDAAAHNKVTIDVAAVSLDRIWPASLYDERSTLKDWPDIGEGEWKDIE